MIYSVGRVTGTVAGPEQMPDVWFLLVSWYLSGLSLLWSGYAGGAHSEAQDNSEVWKAPRSHQKPGKATVLGWTDSDAHLSVQGSSHNPPPNLSGGIFPQSTSLPSPSPEPEVTNGLLTSFRPQQMPTGPCPLSSSTLNNTTKSLVFSEILQVHKELSFMTSVSSSHPGAHTDFTYNALELCYGTILIPATL